MNSRSLVLACVLLVTGFAVLAKTNRHRHSERQGSFDYYLLSLSWAPNYCAGHPGDNSEECRGRNHTGFVLHGLWPQSDRGASPISCAPARPVAHALVDHMLLYMPSRGLIQHEWAEHGTCSGLSPQEYFNQAERAVRSITIPAQYRSLDHAQEFTVEGLEQSFASANHAAPAAFRASCHDGQLVDLEICLTKDLQFRGCSASAHKCAVDRVEMRSSD
jgi:ribonuclease T2